MNPIPHYLSAVVCHWLFGVSATILAVLNLAALVINEMKGNTFGCLTSATGLVGAIVAVCGYRRAVAHARKLGLLPQ